jgi:predicted GTPase
MVKGKKEYRSPESYQKKEKNIIPEVELKPDIEKLQLYTRIKLILAGQLRIVREAMKVLGREKGEQQCEKLLVKLAEDRFTLAVLGQFKRGKSSIMNAIVGRELLSVGVLPITSAITVLKYGPTERLLINRDNSILPDELPVSSLPDYVTETGNPGNIKKVKTACVEVPSPFLRSGIEFVDTPGVGSAITANTATVYSFLPECDAVLFVTGVDTPMTSLELDLLGEIREYVNRIFFVVNKTDLVLDVELSEILGFVTETIQTQTGHDAIKLFPLSARSGLSAKMSGNAILYEKSGLKTLEEALVSFLSEEKSAVFLAAVAQKMLKVLDDEAKIGNFGEVASIVSARSKLEMIYKYIINGRMAEIADVEVQSPVATETVLSIPTPALADIILDLHTRGCPVCQHLTKLATDFFANWQYKISTEEQAQNEFAKELGFCPLHTWQLLAVSSPHGASIGFTRLVEQIAHRLREDNDTLARGEALRQMVHDSRNCRVCEMLHQSEGEYIFRLAVMICEAAGRSQYQRSQGVCLRHLGMLLDATSSSEIREFLLSHAAQQFEDDAQDMRSFAMKHEALRRALQNSNEQDAYRRAIIRIVGGRNVCVPWPEDREI